MTDEPSLLREELQTWPATAPGAAVLRDHDDVVSWGPDQSYAWASVTKLLTALVVLDEVWRENLRLDEPAGPPGATVRHLLAHASGLSVDSDRILSPPGRRRIYSNRGFEVVADLVVRRSGTEFSDLVERRVLKPLGMHATTCPGSPAHGARGPVGDLVRLAGELLRPRHFPAEQLAAATSSVFPELDGVLPGFGRQEPNHWGLGFEIRGDKDPHWTSPLNSPATFGHFGQAGAFLWIDPVRQVAAVAATDTPFGPWAATAWPRFSTRVLETMRSGHRVAALADQEEVGHERGRQTGPRVSR